jgi:hypothetical protein
MKAVWSPDDLQEYLAEAVNAYRIDRDWQQVLDMLTKGGGADDPDLPETPHLTSSLEVTRRTQIVTVYLMTIPCRSLTGGTEGKTLLPFKSILQQASDILQTPLIKGGVVSPGAQGSAASPQTTEVEEAKLAAGDPTEDDGAIAQASDIPKAPPIQAGVMSPGPQGSAAFPQTTDVGDVNLAAGDPIEDKAASAQAGAAAMELVDAAAANASVEATAAQATAATENVQVQLTQVQKLASPEVPLDPIAQVVQPESMAKEEAPAATTDMATLVASREVANHATRHGADHARRRAIHGRACNAGATHGLRSCR